MHMLVAGRELAHQDQARLRNRALARWLLSAGSADRRQGNVTCELREHAGQAYAVVATLDHEVLAWHRVIDCSGRLCLRRQPLDEVPDALLMENLQGVLARSADLRARSQALAAQSAQLRAHSAAAHSRSAKSRRRAGEVHSRNLRFQARPDDDPGNGQVAGPGPIERRPGRITMGLTVTLVTRTHAAAGS